MGDGRFVVAQVSDIHCGDPRYDDAMFRDVIARVNAAEPDLVVIAGDLTTNGYPDEFAQAKERLALLTCPNVAVLIGNHDARNVGYVLFERQFGERYRSWDFTFTVPGSDALGESVFVVGVDSTKPDLDDGELGRHRHKWLRDTLTGDKGLKLVALHHHLVTIPGTGRERNIVWDAGEVLEILTECDVELVLAGHKHVPYVWQVGPTLVVTSGTAATWRTRGDIQPSYNMIEITPESFEVCIIASADGATARSTYPRFPHGTAGRVPTP